MPIRTNGRHRPKPKATDSHSEIIFAPQRTVQGSKTDLGIDEVIVKLAAAECGPEPEALEFRVLSDARIVELVRDSIDPRKVRLLLWKDGEAEIHNSFKHSGKEVIPPRLDASLLEAVRLPAGIAPCDSTPVLFEELWACLSQYVDMAEESLRLTCVFILYTWFQDVFPIAPYLWIIGPYGAGKTTLLALLHCLCRRGITVSDFTPAALYALPGTIRPTLLIDEFEMGSGARGRDLLRLLRTGTTSNGHVFRGSKLYETFCAKVIASRQGPEDAALASRAIFVSLRPTHKALPPLDNSILDKIAAQFQPRLLDYRLRHYPEAAVSFACEVPDYTPRMKDLARALAVPLLGNARLQAQLFSVLRTQDNEARLNRYGEREWAVTAALYADCHRSGSYITAGDLACTVATVLAENGETYCLAARAVGEILRSLGLRTEQLGNQGRGLRLTQAVVRQIHELARDLGLNRSDILHWITVEGGYGGYPCSLCTKLGLMVRADGQPLRCVPVERPRRDRLYS